jgi:uncharacterized membrane protein YedE/YeeE
VIVNLILIVVVFIAIGVAAYITFRSWDDPSDWD